MKQYLIGAMIYLFLGSGVFSKETLFKRPLHWILYGGKYTETDLLPILLRQKTDYKESYIGVVGVNSPLNYKIRFIEFEAEGLLTKHFGKMNHWEIDTLLIARVNHLFYLPMSFAFGEGVSLVSQNPSMENKPKGIEWRSGLIQFDEIRSRNFLNYLMVEMDYRVVDTPSNPRVLLRIHHRSGIFGVFCPPNPACGSNFVSYGIKFAY
jgi:hypothetical protein